MSEPLPRGVVVHVVGAADLASALPVEEGESFPAVFATSRMVALMELAAARAMRGRLGPGELSVGVAIEVEHTAPTPLGATVRATADFLVQDGKLWRFAVSAEDEAGLIGRGTHARAIIAGERLVAGAARRRAGA